MSKKKEKAKNLNDRWYKGYEMGWLEKETEHPDYYLVAEYKAIKEKQNA